MFTTGLVDDSDLPMVDVHLRSHGAIGQQSPGIIGEPSPSLIRTPSPTTVRAEDTYLTSLIAQAQANSHSQRQLGIDVGQAGFGLATEAGTVKTAFGDFASARSRWENHNDNNKNNGGVVRFDDDSWDRATATLISHRADTYSPNGANYPMAVPIASQLNIPAPPKTAPLPTFQPFSDPKPPPLNPGHLAPATAVAAAGHAQNGYYQPSPPSYPVPSNVGDTASQVARHLEGLSLLLNPLLAKTDEVEKLKTEVELWKAEWGRVEREKRSLELEKMGLEQAMVTQVSKPKSAGPPFTAVLIDGDGLIFQDHLIQAGFQGGQLAAQTLLSALPNLAASASASSAAGAEVTVTAQGNIVDGNGGEAGAGVSGAVEARELGSVIVQVFINKAGLGATLTKAGLVKTYSEYDKFWQGFSAAHELFTVCDVGQGKEASDAKIREYLRLYAKNAQCEMIVLGASHDNGYANILSSLQTESRLSKLLLLKGYSDLAPQLKHYSSRVVSIPDLFRTDKINATPSFASIAKQPNAEKAEISPIFTASQLTASNKKTTKNAPAIGNQPALITVSDSSSDALSDGVEVFQWVDETLQPKKNKKKDGKVKNKETKLKEVEEDEWTEMKGKKKAKVGKKAAQAAQAVRTLDPRPCHTYYLSTYGCKNGDGCSYGHDYDLNEAQMDELARLAKCMPCPFAKNNKCRFTDEDCVYGHKCPAGVRCTFGDTCRFIELPDAHDV